MRSRRSTARRSPSPLTDRLATLVIGFAIGAAGGLLVVGLCVPGGAGASSLPFAPVTSPVLFLLVFRYPLGALVGGAVGALLLSRAARER
jgi:hypothetical protein